MNNLRIAEITNGLQLKDHKWISNHVKERDDECNDELLEFMVHLLENAEHREIKNANNSVCVYCQNYIS